MVCKLLCIALGARSCPRARDTGQPAGKATGWRKVSERCLESRWAGSKGCWHGGGRLCKEAKTQSKYLLASLPEPGTRVLRSRPRSAPASPAMLGAGAR